MSLIISLITKSQALLGRTGRAREERESYGNIKGGGGNGGGGIQQDDALSSKLDEEGDKLESLLST